MRIVGLRRFTTFCRERRILRFWHVNINIYISHIITDSHDSFRITLPVNFRSRSQPVSNHRLLLQTIDSGSWKASPRPGWLPLIQSRQHSVACACVNFLTIFRHDATDARRGSARRRRDGEIIPHLMSSTFHRLTSRHHAITARPQGCRAGQWE